MKRVILAALLLIVTALSGCHPISGDVTDLMSPPKLTAEQQSIENALNTKMGAGKYQLKYPMEGEYRSAFILHNIDSDPEPEAIAFYCPITDNAGTHVMILKKVKNQWQVINDFNGGGSDVDEISFGDFYGNGHDDIAIAWTQLTGTDLQLSIYSETGKKYTYANTFTDMKVVNLTDDHVQDVLLLKLDKALQKATSTLISYQDGRFSEIGTAQMDPTVDRYADIYNTKIDNQPAVFIDGYKGQHDMLTEILTWKDGVLQSPLRENDQDTVSTTLRDVPIKCEDFDGDGIYEIPSAVELPGYGSATDFSKKLWLVSWSVFSKGTLSTPPEFSCVMNNNEGYYFKYPEKWVKDGKLTVTVDNSAGDNSWVFKKWNGTKMNEKLFSIEVYTESAWGGLKQSEFNLSGTYQIDDVNGLVYVAVFNLSEVSDPMHFDYNSFMPNFKFMK